MAGTDGFRCSWRFARSESGADVAKGELQDLDDEGRGYLTQAMHEYSKGTLIPRKVKPVGDGLMEITVNRGSDHYRCIFFHTKPFIAVALKIFMKKSNKMPPRHLETAKERRGVWNSRSE